MAEKRTSCKSFLAAHRGMAVLLAAELLCLLVLLARCFKPLYTRQLDFTQMTMDSAQENCAYSVQDGALIVDTTGAAEPEEKNAALLTLTSPAVILPSDAYEVIVNYDSDQWKLYEKPIAFQFINDGMTGLFDGGTEPWEYADKDAQLVLDGAHYSVTGRIWVKPGNTKGFTLTLKALTPARTVIQSIVFTPKRAYRVIQLLAALLLFAGLDVLLLLFVGDGEVPICLKGHRRTILMLAAICLAACLPYTTGLEYVGWDFSFHLERIAQVAAELHNGQFPVRMMTGMLNGYGYANSLYYCDIFLYLPALLYNCMVPLGICYNIYGTAVTVCTCGTAYYSLRKLCKKPYAAYVGTAVYLLNGYRLVNVYMRSAVGEYTAMVFLPLVAVHAYLLYTKEKTTYHDWLPLALGMAGLVQCHVLTFELTCLTLTVLALVFWRRTFSKNRLSALLKAAGTAVGLCAWFIVPFLQSMLTQNVQVNDMYAQQFQENGTSLFFLLNPFPVSILWFMEQQGAGNGDAVVHAATLHGVHGVLGAPLMAGILLVGYMLLRRKAWNDGKTSAPVRVMMATAGVMMVFSLRLFPWNFLFTCFENTVIHKLLGMPQFPWRWLSIAAVLISVCTTLALEELSRRKKDTAQKVGVTLLAISLLYAAGFCIYPGANAERLTYTATNADSMKVVNGEYLLPGSPDLNYARPQTNSDDLKIKYYDKIDGIAYATLENTGAEPAELTLPIYDYGNYVVTDDTGTAWPTETSKDSLLEVSVPAGFAGGITVRYREPVLWRIMEIVSAATLAATVFGCLTQRRKEKTTAQQA